MGAIANSTAVLVRDFSQYEYRWVGFLTLTQQKREVPTKIYEQPWVKDTAKANVGAPGGDYSIYRTEYTVARDGITAKVTSEWRDETEAWAAV